MLNKNKISFFNLLVSKTFSFAYKIIYLSQISGWIEKPSFCLHRFLLSHTSSKKRIVKEDSSWLKNIERICSKSLFSKTKNADIKRKQNEIDFCKPYKETISQYETIMYL